MTLTIQELRARQNGESVKELEDCIKAAGNGGLVLELKGFRVLKKGDQSRSVLPSVIYDAVDGVGYRTSSRTLDRLQELLAEVKAVDVKESLKIKFSMKESNEVDTKTGLKRQYITFE